MAAAAEQTIYTPPQLARRYGVSEDKVVRWILAGELAAMNLATTPNGRPRYKITQEAVDAFEERRAVLSRPAQPTRRKRRATPAGFVRHFRGGHKDTPGEPAPEEAVPIQREAEA